MPTELSAILQPTLASKPILFAYTDGGGDHRSTFLSVQLSWILLFLELDLDMLVTCRTAPGHSYSNPAERCMSILNIGLQNCAFARGKSTAECEKQFRACNGLEALRKLQPVAQKAWAESVDPVKKTVEHRFNRLVYAEEQVRVHDPATDDQVASFFKKAADVDPGIDITNSAPHQKDLKPKERLQGFLQTHSRQRHYSFQLRKCEKDPCEFGLCKPRRSPTAVQLDWLPDPVIDDADPQHYLPYSKVKGRDTDDASRPSLQKCATKAVEQGCPVSLLTSQRVRRTVTCSECQKCRCVYSKVALSSADSAVLDGALAELEYSCGSPLLPTGHPLAATVFVRMALSCNDPVELAYYACKHGYPSVCCYCTGHEAARPQEYLAKYFTVLPICQVCSLTRPVVTRMPKAGSKRKAGTQ
eukprot:scpid23388/ scgid23400/ 